MEYEQKFLLQQATNLDMRFEDFYKLYEEDLKPKLKLNTWRTKDVIFQKKLIPYFKDKKMNEISPADIIKWQNEMIKKRQADDKPYKPTYLKTMQSELSAIFNHAVRFYNLRENPVKKAGTIGKGKADEMDFWTKEEYFKFIECVKDKPISYYAFQILYWCGIREGELLALTPADIDFENKKLHITKSYQYINGEDIITDPKTEKSRRDVVIPDFLVEELRQFIGMLYGYGRDDRKIKDYFEHVAGLNQDMAVEIIFQCGDKKYWEEHWENKDYMSEVFDYILDCLQKLLPEFKIANAVIHFDEASPHMHVVGVPVWEGAKRGLSKKVSKRNVFTPQTLSVILQDKLRAEASYGFEYYFKEELAEKKKGHNHDLSVTEYKVAQESKKLADIKQQNNEEQEKNTKLRSNNARISYQITTQEQRNSRNLDVIAADEDRLETVRSNINAAEAEYIKYADMITDKKNNLEQLSSKESELIERAKIAESVYDMFCRGEYDDVRDKLIDVMYENQKLREENVTLKELLEKAYEFMKQFVIDGVNLLEKFLESVGKVVGKIKNKYDR